VPRASFKALAPVRGGVAFWSSCWLRVNACPADLDAAFKGQPFYASIAHDVREGLV
jgi:hypothetical protein